MKVSVLASGSKGNCCFIQTQSGNFLIDLGVSTLYINENLKNFGLSGKDIDGVFITHTHTDHINGLKTFIKRYNSLIYLSQKMYDELSKEILIDNYVILEDTFYIDNLNITPIKTSHDTDDSLGYIFDENNKSFVYITDTGYINVKNHKKLENKDIYVFESNHDIDMLMNNPKYPYHLKQRILGDKGHLSNVDSSYYLSKFIGDKTKCVILAHLSEHNNNPDLALDVLKKTLKESNKDFDKIIIANQSERTELIEV